ncbi:keratin, type I cytoskeletal 9-like [Homalodisca vitripennis]|uniref:keratin, type I cytoskeletal 9-like n=1 Tax=Homalodisca vitripennis TaxID=197043 RepID=UPI001EEA7CBA|nr:keratin, type I cytoskeletal 9-like [Homalodisca vitripennis]XP_046662568.1 keratin, type I cytoskeletal 9-like [Homalodisca vitripennis]
MDISSSTVILGLLVVVPSVLADCRPGPYPYCQDWNIGINRVNPRGAVVYGHANVPIHQGSSSSAHGQVHGSRVFGGPYSGAQTVGGNLNYQHNNGVHGSVGATHTRGVGNSFSASAGGSGKLGPGTLSVGGGASTIPGSSRVQGQVGATYSVPLP